MANRFSAKIIQLAKSNLILSALFLLSILWIVVSYLVYRFEIGVQGSNITSFGDSIWWGIVTFLTVGYGDRYPVTVEGRVFASFLMLGGVLTTAIVTSKISSYFLEQVLREVKGLVDTSKLKNHLVVCGWKENMDELLHHILQFSEGMNSDQIVLIANLPASTVDGLKEVPELSKMHFIIGDYFEVSNLKRAAPEKARKVVILADRTPGPNGSIPSPTEVDARTVMTAMTLSNIARGTLVAAELLDPKMDQYLKIASVSEIIYSREYSRLLLGNAAVGTGIANVVYDLLDPHTPNVITTHPISDKHWNQDYIQFKKEFESKNPHSNVIGILENTGNSQRIKELAIRQAQKTPDMAKFVENLKGVKELKCNHPVFNPNPDYKLMEGSMVIVIENRTKLKDSKNRNEGAQVAHG